MQIKAGVQSKDFEFLTQNNEQKKLSDIYGSKRHTVLLFLRYYGCPLCQMELADYKKMYQQFKENDTEVILVLQSSQETMEKSGETYPYYIACDTEKALFDLYEVKPAKSMKDMLSPKTIFRVLKSRVKGIKHGEYEGEELQLPAVFLLDSKGTVKYSKYAKNLADLPSADKMIAMIKG